MVAHRHQGEIKDREFVYKIFEFVYKIKVLNIRQKRDFSIFSRFLRRLMKSDMVVMPNQGYIRN